MAIRILFLVILSVAAASGTGCCRGFNFLQYRRPDLLPTYDNPTPYGNFLTDQEPPCENTVFPPESLPKFENPLPRFYPPYVEHKNIAHKCMCSKSIASQRMVADVPPYYKRGFCNDPMVETITPSCGSPCGQYSCGQYGGCMQFGQCGHYDHQYSHCAQYEHCTVPPTLFRQPPHRVLPLTLPASCVC